MIAAGVGGSAAFAELDADDVRTLANLGLWGAFGGRAAEALRLFEALTRLRPGAAWPHVGTAQALLASGRAHQAIRALEAALDASPDDAEIRALLGLALRVGRQGAHERRVLGPLVDAASDSGGARLARGLAAADAPLSA
jgi:tetratricopeptide (TPR) repeat protein